MTTKKGRYLNLFSDRAFLRVFGTERDKAITLAFLNSVLEQDEQIVGFHFASNAQAPENPSDRGIVLDLHCRTADGRRIIIELQKRRQTYFRERTLFYATWPIQSQGVRGVWDYNIKAVYVISILDFLINKESSDNRIVSRKMIQDTETSEIWTDKLCFINIEIPRFQKKLEDCVSLIDKWFFVLKNLHKLMQKPPEWQEEVFNHLFEITDKSRFEEKEILDFERSETEYDTMKNALDYAIQEGRTEGLAFGREEGRAAGREEGRAAGREEGREAGRAEVRLDALRDKVQTIQNMLDKGCDWSFIESVIHVNEKQFHEMKASLP